MPALLDQVLALLELLLLELASDKRSTVSIHAVGEVAAGHTGLASCEADELTVIHIRPFLHRSIAASSSFVLLAVTSACPPFFTRGFHRQGCRHL